MHIGGATGQRRTVRLPGRVTTGSFSPDGRLLALSWEREAGTGSHLAIVDTRTGSVRSVRGPPGGFADPPIWTADSGRFFFGSTEPGRTALTASVWTYVVGSPHPTALRYLSSQLIRPLAVLPVSAASPASS